MFYTKTVDSVVAKFKQMVLDLEDVAQEHETDVVEHNTKIAEHQTAVAEAEREAIRARGISAKIKALLGE